MQLNFEIDSDHPCFEPMTMYVASWAGLTAGINLKTTLESYALYELKKKCDLGRPELHTGPLTLNSTTGGGKTMVTNFCDWIMYVCTCSNDCPEKLIVSYTLEEQNKATESERTVGTLRNVNFLMRQMICQAIGTAYEINKSAIVRRWTSNPQQWPSEIQLFRHFRNASFHGNQFDIRSNKKGRSVIDPNAPPTWRHLVLSDDSFSGTQFAGKFFSIGDALPFLYEVGNQLR